MPLFSSVEIDPRNQPLALQIEDDLLVPLRLDTKNAWSTRRARWRDLTSRWVSVTAGLNSAQLAMLRALFEQCAENGAVQINSLGESGLEKLRECYRSGIEIFSSPAREFVYVPVEIGSNLRLQMTENDVGLRIEATPLMNPPENLPPVRLPGFCIAPACSRQIHESLFELQAQVAVVPPDETDHFWAQWEQWAEQSEINALLTLESRQLVESHHFGVATLYGILEMNPQDKRQIEFNWSIKRESAVGKVISLPLQTQNPSGLESKLMLRLGAHLGWREEAAREFFNHVFPIWELNRLRDLVTQINTSEYAQAVISPQLDQVNIFSEVPEMALDITDAAGEYNLRLDWILGTERISSADFLPALGRSDRWWQSPQGNWVDLYSAKNRDIQAILQEFNELGLEDFQHGSGWKIDISQLGLVEALGRISQTRQYAHSWEESARALLEPRPAPALSLPQGQWRPYQEEGYQWLYARAVAGLGGILADDMGLGKTLQMLAVVAALRQTQNQSKEKTSRESLDSKPALAIVPASLLSTWEEQTRRWFPQLSVLVQSVSVGKTAADWERKTQEITHADLVLTTYTLARIDIDFWEKHEFSGLIFDEAQAVKNPATSTHKALSQLKARWAFALSGTPLENRERDLWSIFALTVPKLLPPLPVFERRLSSTVLSERTSVHRALSARISPFLLRRTKEAVAEEIPAKTEQVINLNLEPQQAELYQKYLLVARSEASQTGAKRINVLTALTRLRQLALSARLINPHLSEDGAKVDYLLQSLPDLAGQNHNILVFSQFTSFLNLLRTRLDAVGLPYAYLDGGTRDRGGQIDFFQQGEAQVFLISLKSGGFGLNLTAADYVFLCDPWWNPAVEAQAIDRAHRIGQTRPVNVYRLVAKNTIEQRVLAMQERKRELFNQVLTVAANREVSPRITLAELRALLD